jgi:hypothetical protein
MIAKANQRLELDSMISILKSSSTLRSTFCKYLINSLNVERYPLRSALTLTHQLHCKFYVLHYYLAIVFFVLDSNPEPHLDNLVEVLKRILHYTLDAKITWKNAKELELLPRRT